MADISQVKIGNNYYDIKDAVARGLIPSISSSDEGKLLTAHIDDKTGDGYTEWGNLNINGVPDVSSSDSGKVLTAYYDDKMGEGVAYWSQSSGASIQKLLIDKSSLSYDDKSAAYTYYMGDYSIPVSHVINVRTYDGDAKYKNITYNIREWNSICYVLYFDSTEYDALSSYVEFIYYA